LTTKSTKVKPVSILSKTLSVKQPVETIKQLVVFLLLFENTSFSKGLKSNNLGSVL